MAENGWKSQRQICTTPGLVTARRSILGPPAEGWPGPSGDNDGEHHDDHVVIMMILNYSDEDGGKVWLNVLWQVIRQFNPQGRNHLSSFLSFWWAWCSWYFDQVSQIVGYIYVWFGTNHITKLIFRDVRGSIFCFLAGRANDQNPHGERKRDP